MKRRTASSSKATARCSAVCSSNLVGNAYRYGRENGYIRVKVERADGCVLLSVEDNGVGIAPEQQEKVFNRFYQAGRGAQRRGYGLGLAMAREIAPAARAATSA